MATRTRRWTGGWALAAMMMLGMIAPGQTATTGTMALQRPTEAIEPANCVTAECHANVKQYPVLHGPAGSDSCDACHLLASAEKHTFTLWRDKEKLCTFCHEFSTGMLPVVHRPVVLGECLGCHNPHGGRDRSFVREATMAQTCGRCHESVAAGRMFLHDPVKEDSCGSCHRAHASRYPMMLDAVGTALCLTCHDDFGAQMAAVKFTHQALEEGCMRCHDVHASSHPMGINDTMSELCLGCHEPIRERTQAAFAHPAVMDERACLTCHTAHGGDLDALLADLPVRVCMTCHDKEIESAAGGVVASVSDILDPARFKHSPIADGQCGGCHTTHGGDQPLLLQRALATEFYEPFAVENYELCFGCHDRQLAERETTDALTKFRNGERNLHFVHVAAEEFGRNCRVCHGAHTGEFEALIRGQVKFGNWDMPVKFERWPTGGTCNTGCHPPYAYDRENPVESNLTVVAGQAVPRVPSADKREPVRAQFAARDIYGNAVVVPDARRPSLLMFLRADQPQSREVVKMVDAANGQVDPAQVVVIFCGEDAGIDAREFAARHSPDWLVVADYAQALSRPLGVDVWPATLVVQPDGAVVAHIGGAPPSMTIDVEAYLDLAAGRIDREALAARLGDHGLVGDGPARRAAWHLQMGAKLLAEGRATEARTLLADGLALDPESPALQLALVRALLAVGDAPGAIARLERLPAGAAETWERDLLRARAQALLGRWSEARRLAEGVLAQMPHAGEAHYLMGQVHEHAGEWEKAAEAYRRAYAEGGR